MIVQAQKEKFKFWKVKIDKVGPAAKSAGSTSDRYVWKLSVYRYVW